MAMNDDILLHRNYFEQPGIQNSSFAAAIERGAYDLQDSVAAAGVPDPNVTVVIRTRNQRQQLEGLLDDLKRQEFSGQKQIIVVDTHSTDGTAEFARRNADEVVALEQSTFNYANSLNEGIKRAVHPYVFTFVGHSALTNTQTLRAISPWVNWPKFGGVYGAAVLDGEATLGDRLIGRLQNNAQRLRPVSRLKVWEGGALVAHRSVVALDAWQEIGGYNEAFGNGGEDTDFARRLIEAGFTIVRDPALSVHHSYHLNLWRTLRHIKHLRDLRSAEPQDFDQGILAWRTDLADLEKTIQLPEAA